ncbi:MAG: metallophosphoesterase [Acidobacteriaceae bacterium]|nr:metallophosphoesterase [Acidobacteriaceae bacterium]
MPSKRPSRSLSVTAERSLEELLEPRIAVERHFAQLGRTYRHGKLHRFFEMYVTRPVLRNGLQLAGLYERGKRNALNPELRTVPMYFDGLPDEYDGFQILHLSDFHIDGTDGLTEVLAERLSELRPDLCVFTGDYRFEDRGPCDAVYPRMRSIVSSIRARHGIFGILGNHDAGEIAYQLEDMGVQMLVNEFAEINQGGESLWLAGVDDNFDYGTHDLEKALSSVPSDGFKILLAHAPELYDAAADKGIDLYLAGHTHAGQIRVPVLGALKHNARCPRAYIHGHWRHRGMQGYTSAGIGCSSLPIRYNCRPEIVLVELRRGQP